MVENGDTIILLDGDLIIHRNALETAYRLGNIATRKQLKWLCCTKREQNAIIHAMHVLIRDPAEKAEGKRIRRFI